MLDYSLFSVRSISPDDVNLAHAHKCMTDDYGLGVQSPIGDAYKQVIYSGLNTRLQSSDITPPFKAAFVDFAPMWEAIIDNDPPGYAAFGYTSNGWCLTGPCCTTVNHWYVNEK